jgi:hypothetical protein
MEGILGKTALHQEKKEEKQEKGLTDSPYPDEVFCLQRITFF